MSELAPGSVSLEEDNSASFEPPTQEPAAEAPATPPPAQAATEDTEPEGTIVNPGGEKLVPLGALASVREKVREKESALAAKDAEIAALKDKASKWDAAAGEWQAVQPLIRQIKNGQYQQPAPAKPVVNEKAVEYAKFLDLYKTDGTPDVERAQRILDLNAAQAQEAARHVVQPLYQHTAQQQSALLREKVAATQAPNGVTVDRAILDQIWSMVPPEMSARPEVAAMLWRQALADTVLQGKYKAPVTPPPPPAHTESLGGNAPTRELSQIDRNAMQAASIKPSDYEKIAGNFKPGQNNSLE